MRVIEYGDFDKPRYRALYEPLGSWPRGLHHCCQKGHRTVRAASYHGARILRDGAIAEWNRERNPAVV